MRVVRLCGIDDQAFLAHFEGDSAKEALERDMCYMRSLGIQVMPAFLVECGGKAALINRVVSAGALRRAIEGVRE